MDLLFSAVLALGAIWLFGKVGFIILDKMSFGWFGLSKRYNKATVNVLKSAKRGGTGFVARHGYREALFRIVLYALYALIGLMALSLINKILSTPPSQ